MVAKRLGGVHEVGDCLQPQILVVTGGKALRGNAGEALFGAVAQRAIGVRGDPTAAGGLGFGVRTGLFEGDGEISRGMLGNRRRFSPGLTRYPASANGRSFGMRRFGRRTGYMSALWR
jgi:hypothetical protein